MNRGGRTGTGRVIRAKRYVSAPAGAYPASVPPAARSFALADEERADEPELDPAATLLMQRPAELALAERPETSPPIEEPFAEPTLEEQIFGPATAQAEEPSEPQESLDDPGIDQQVDGITPLALGEAHADDATTVAPPDAELGARRGVLGTLVGALAGGSMGAVVALGLLALTRGGGLWDQIREPVTLWNSVDSSMVRVSAVLVMLGFVVLGTSLGRGRSRPRS